MEKFEKKKKIGKLGMNRERERENEFSIRWLMIGLHAK